MFLYIYHYVITKNYSIHIYLFKIHDYYGFLISHYDIFYNSSIGHKHMGVSKNGPKVNIKERNLRYNPILDFENNF
jgi:hypothetical protein